MKWNGQLMSSFKYLGNNSFGDEYDNVSFELRLGGGIKATLTFETKTYIGEKFLKYPDWQMDIRLKDLYTLLRPAYNNVYKT
jgi:hypothetical protein